MKKKVSPHKFKFRFLDKSTEAAYEAAKAAGRPVVEAIAGNRSGDGYDFAGMLIDGKVEAQVLGSHPADWDDYLDAPEPKKNAAKKIARWLSTLYFRNQCGKIKEARISAAQLIDPTMAVDSAERVYRREEKQVLARELRDYKQTVILRDNSNGIWVFAAHKTATIERHADGHRLIGTFWRVRIGTKNAERVCQDYFYALPGSCRKSGGTIFRNLVA